MDQEYLIRKIEKYADEKGVPIMEKEGIEFLTEFIKLNKVKNILEIGSAIGYSAINMALANEDVTVTTIERDKDRYIEAVKNVKKLELDSRITLILADALDFNTSEEYDLIFIDAGFTVVFQSVLFKLKACLSQFYVIFFVCDFSVFFLISSIKLAFTMRIKIVTQT